MNEDSPIVQKLSRVGPAGWLVGVLLVIVLVAGFASDPDGTMQGYTFAYVFWASLTLGCFGMMLLQNTLKAKWGLSVIRIFEAGGSPGNLVALAVMFLPIALKLDHVFPWANDERVMHDHVLQANHFYLNAPFFLVRAAIFFLVWIGLSSLMRKSTIRQDETLNMAEMDKRVNWSAPGLVIFFITMTFAATDWAMSIEPHYYSTVYGLLFAVGAGFSATSLAVFILLAFSKEKPYVEVVNAKLTRDLGNILFTLTMLWGYLMLAQFLITWAGNIPAEVRYYIKRSDNNQTSDWYILTSVLVLLQFFVPFLSLLAPRTKRYAKNLMWTALLMFLIRIINIYWLVMPAFANRTTVGSSLGHWQDYVAFVALGGIWFGMFGSQIKKASLLPRYDTRLQEAQGHA